MNIKHLIAAVAVFTATGAAFAQQAEFVAPDAHFVSSKTRTQVIAELRQAQANGTYLVGGAETSGLLAQIVRPSSSVVQASTAEAKSRAQVRAELVAAQLDGSYVVGGEEFAGQVTKLGRGHDTRGQVRVARQVNGQQDSNTSVTTGRTRAEVRAEAIQASTERHVGAIGDTYFGG